MSKKSRDEHDRQEDRHEGNAPTVDVPPVYASTPALKEYEITEPSMLPREKAEQLEQQAMPEAERQVGREQADGELRELGKAEDSKADELQRRLRELKPADPAPSPAVQAFQDWRQKARDLRLDLEKERAKQQAIADAAHRELAKIEEAIHASRAQTGPDREWLEPGMIRDQPV
jgi:hypothetical protein